MATLDAEKGQKLRPENEPVDPGNVVALGDVGKQTMTVRNDFSEPAIAPPDAGAPSLTLYTMTHEADRPSPPHPNCYFVPGTRLIAGEYPFTADPATARAKLCGCLDAGVTTFIDLTEPHELAPYEAALHDEARARGAGLKYVRLPIPDMRTPTPARMREVLDAIDHALGDGGTVYLHCWGGIGRTGAVVGCYLVRHGATGEEVLRQVAALYAMMSPGKLRRHPKSPQTPQQRAFVREWAEEQATR